MIGSLRNHWEYFPEEIWEPLAAHEKSPPDLFNDLYDAANDFLALPTSGPPFQEIRNDEIKAHEAFCALKGSDFVSEAVVVEFLEAANEVIADYELSGYTEFFKLLLRVLPPI
jgi:hypothetical protein